MLSCPSTMETISLAVATGAGISAESGIPTFRDAGGLWEGYRPEDVATPEAFRRDPKLVWQFYLDRRKTALKVSPNPGHLAIAQWQERFGEVPVITQNIDGLHQRAGSRRVLELHGSLWKRYCLACHRKEEDLATEMPGGEMPRCACSGMLRPSIVWFGESLPEDALEESFRLARSVKRLVVVGTSNQVYPAASIPLLALEAGAEVIEVNPQETPLSSQASRFIKGKAGEILPELLSTLGW